MRTPMSPVDAMVSALQGPAKQAVDRARDSALKHVRDTRKALRDGIEQGRASAEKGEKIVTAVVDHVCDLIGDIMQRWPVGVKPPA